MYKESRSAREFDRLLRQFHLRVGAQLNLRAGSETKGPLRSRRLVGDDPRRGSSRQSRPLLRER